MPLPRAEDVLAISADHVADFIRDQTSSKRLSALMHDLNEQVLFSDTTTAERARQAIRHLGFTVHA